MSNLYWTSCIILLPIVRRSYVISQQSVNIIRYPGDVELLSQVFWLYDQCCPITDVRLILLQYPSNMQWQNDFFVCDFQPPEHTLMYSWEIFRCLFFYCYNFCFKLAKHFNSIMCRWRAYFNLWCYLFDIAHIYYCGDLFYWYIKSEASGRLCWIDQIN
jgi:hypothetical protein